MRRSGWRFLAVLLTMSALLIGWRAFAAGRPANPRSLLQHEDHEHSEPVERWATLGGPIFQHWNTSNGLPTPRVGSIVQDADGFLWMGTPEGLARWDGYRFRVYQHDARDETSLPDSNISSLLVDHKGRLWVGTQLGGLARYDHHNDRFIRVGSGEHGLLHAGVWVLEDDGDQGIWVGSVGGLDHYLPDQGTVHHYNYNQDPLQDNSSYVRTLLRDRNGNLWIGTTEGVFVRDGRTAKVRAVPLNADDEDSSDKPEIASLTQASDGRIWVGTSGQGVYLIDPATREARHLSIRLGALQLRSERITAICEAAPGEIWLGTFGDGIVIVDAQGEHPRRVRHDSGVASSLASDSINVITRDRAGMLWVGLLDGLSRSARVQGGLRTLSGDGLWPGSLTEANVASVTVMRDGSIWVGLPRKGIDIIDSAADHIVSVTPDPNHPESSLPGMPVYAVSEPRNHFVYVATLGGLYALDTRNFAAHRLSWPGRNPGLAVQAMQQDGDILWVGGIDGLWRVDVRDPAHVVGSRPPGSDELAREDIWSMYLRNHDELWIGTAHSGVFRYKMVIGGLRRFARQSDDPGSLPHNFVTSILFDRKDRLWVSTLGGGVARWDAPDASSLPKFRTVDTSQGLPNRYVDKLLEDRSGRIWASTDAGIALIDAETLTVKSLQRGDGLGVVDYHANVGARTAQGEILFGGTGGLTIIKPELYRPDDRPAPVVVTEVKVGGQPIPSTRFNGLRGAKPEPVIIPSDANSIAVEFSALDYAAPERNRYAYKLEGYDKDWIDTDPTQRHLAINNPLPGDYRLAVYHNLPPGQYTLRIKGSNHAGVFAGQDLTVPIRVLPSWFQSWWVRLLGVVLTIGAVVAFVQGRTYYLRVRQRALERSVDERTSELLESRTQLLEKNLELARLNKLQEEQQSELTRFLAVASHDLRQPMHALSLYLEALANFKLEQAGQPVLESARNCAQILDDMFAALLDLSRLDARTVEPLIKPFPVASLLQRVAVEFEPQARAKGLTLKVVPNRLWARSDPALIEQILRNLVSNAVRYTEHGTVLIGCRRRSDKVRVCVYDTGVGIAPDQQRTVFEEFFQVGSGGRVRDRNTGLGLGLALVRRISRLLGTNVTLKSELGRGSLFAFDLPRTAVQAPLQDVEAVRSDAARAALTDTLVVVIDDEEVILGAMQVLLSQWGCEVVLARSSDEAIAQLVDSPRRPDVLICDLELRITETGIDAAHHLRDEFNHEIPAILITGAITDDAVSEARKQGWRVLHKPVNAQELHSCLSEVVLAAGAETDQAIETEAEASVHDDAVARMAQN